MFDEISVEMRHSKRGNRLVTKKTQVTLQSTTASSSVTASVATQPPTQAEQVPGPADIPEYNEVAFDDPELRPPRIGKVRYRFR